MDVLLDILFVILLNLVFLSATEAAKCSYYRVGFRKVQYKYCSTSCCGSSSSRYCCAGKGGLSTFGIVLIVVAVIAVISSIVLIYCCNRRRATPGQVLSTQPNAQVIEIGVIQTRNVNPGYTGTGNDIRNNQSQSRIQELDSGILRPPDYQTVMDESRSSPPRYSSIYKSGHESKPN